MTSTTIPLNEGMRWWKHSTVMKSSPYTPCCMMMRVIPHKPMIIKAFLENGK